MWCVWCVGMCVGLCEYVGACVCDVRIRKCECVRCVLCVGMCVVVCVCGYVCWFVRLCRSVCV